MLSKREGKSSITVYNSLYKIYMSQEIKYMFGFTDQLTFVFIEPIKTNDGLFYQSISTNDVLDIAFLPLLL